MSTSPSPPSPSVLPWSHAAAGLVLAAALIGGAGRAHAALGDPATAVANDRAALQGSLKTTSTAAFDVHEITAPADTTVREYASRDGTVFAVTWSGPRVPDLHVVLGRYYAAYVAGATAAAGRTHRAGHHVLSFTAPSLTAEVVRFQRRALGRVYLPTHLPAGVTPGDLR